jgi:hypothetical protein
VDDLMNERMNENDKTREQLRQDTEGATRTEQQGVILVRKERNYRSIECKSLGAVR